jgi:hypothetical protein
MGHATKDMEVLESKAGNNYGRFGLAIAKSGDYETTTFWNVTVFGKNAEKTVSKGDLVMVMNAEPVAEQKDDGRIFPSLIGGVLINLEDWRQKKNAKENGTSAPKEDGRRGWAADNWDDENPPF